MTEALTRAARAISDKWLEKADDCTVRIGPPVIARAAILSFLDGEDVVEACARAMLARLDDGRKVGCFAPPTEHDEDIGSPADCARAAIAALRALVQEEK